MQTFVKEILFASALVAAITPATAGNLQLPGLFSDHMVLQQGVPLKVWGKADAGDKIKITFNNSTAEATADATGRWTAKLDKQKAGGPYELTVSADDDTTTIKDVLVGEVWVCSGQSNMDFPLKRASTSEEAIKSSSNNQIRLFKVPRNKDVKPLANFTTDTQWEISSPESTPDFSAVGYFFGQDIQKELNVPVGLIQSSWGGTAAEWWTPLEGLKQLPYLKAAADEMEHAEPDSKLTDDYRKAAYGWKKGVMAKDPGNGKKDGGWYKPEFDDSSWESASEPAMLSKMNMDKFDGSVWYRRTFDLTAEQAKMGATLSFCADDQDFAYINGTQVGFSDVAGKLRHYPVQTNLLKPGKNTVALQVWDWGKDGGLCGSADDLHLELTDGHASQTIALAGEWHHKPGVSLNSMKKRPQAPQSIRPTVLYNAMINPMINYAIKGVIWYQGEANARSDSAELYDQTLGMMVKQWREKWGLGDFPFIQVQLASFRKIEPEPGNSVWALLRESQENLMRMAKNIGMATAIDVGSETDIHPTDKQTVGKRLALNALAMAYDKDIEYLGPIYKSSEVKDGKIILHFEHADQLKSSDGKDLKGFSIAGADKQFVWADARIDGNTIVVSSDKIKEPVAARYGWQDYVTGNLVNGAGLPASPFRTDKPAGK